MEATKVFDVENSKYRINSIWNRTQIGAKTKLRNSLKILTKRNNFMMRSRQLFQFEIISLKHRYKTFTCNGKFIGFLKTIIFLWLCNTVSYFI